MKKSVASYWLTPEDKEIIENVARHFGVSKSKAVAFILQSFKDAAELAALSTNTPSIAAPSSGPQEN